MSGKAIGATIVAVGVIAAGGYYGVKSHANRQAKQEISEIQEEIKDYGQIEYGSVNTKLFDRSIDINEVVITSNDTNEKIEIERLIVHSFDEKNDPPQFGSISAQGINLPVESLDAEQQEILRSLGYDALSLDTDVDYRADPDQGTVELSMIHLVENVGEIAGDFNFGNIVFENGEPVESPNIAIHSASLSYRDNSLIPRIYQFAADQENTSVDEFKEQLVDSLGMLTIESPHNPVMAELASALETFINDPQQLRVSLSPAEPVVMGQLMFTPPDRIPEILGLEIAANR